MAEQQNPLLSGTDAGGLPEIEPDTTEDHFFDDGDPERGWFRNKQGLKLATYIWRAEGVAKGVVVAVHGIDGHCRFEFMHFEGLKNGRATAAQFDGSWAQGLTRAGYTVYAFDLQSHGRSQGVEEGKGCYVERFQDFVDDIILYYSMARALNPDLPVFLLGASMGGCLCSRVGEQISSTSPMDGVILLCPALNVDKVKRQCKNRILLPLVGCLSRLYPTLPLGDKAFNKMFPVMDEIIANDKLSYQGKIRARIADEFIKTIDAAAEDAPNMVAPLLMIHSSLDTMCDPIGTKEFYANCASTDKTLDILPEEDNFWHGLMHEPGNEERILPVVIKWMDDRLSKRGK